MNHLTNKPFNHLTSSITRYALYALLIFTPLARASVQDWAITTIHLIILIALTTFLIEKTLTWNWQWIKTSLDKPILCLLLLCLLSTVFSLHRQTSFWSTILLLNYLTIFYLVVHTTSTRSQSKHLIYLIVGVAFFISVFGLFKIAGANLFPWWDYPERIANQLSSVYGNRNHLAGYMEMTIPLLLGLSLTGYRGGKLLLILSLTFLLLTALVLTLSRGGWISAFVGLTFMSGALLVDQYFEKKRLLLFIIGGFFVVIFLTLSSTPVVEKILTFEQKYDMPSFKGRVAIWRGIVKIIQNHPFLGTGPGTFAITFTRFQLPGQNVRFVYGHNDYLHLTSEVGLLLVPVMIWMIIALYKKGFYKLKNPSRLVRGITLGALSGITAILFHSIVDFNLHIPANALLFTTLAALVVAPVPKENEFLN